MIQESQCQAILAQSVERVAFNHVVVGSIPTDGVLKSHRYKISWAFIECKAMFSVEFAHT